MRRSAYALKLLEANMAGIVMWLLGVPLFVIVFLYLIF